MAEGLMTPCRDAADSPWAGDSECRAAGKRKQQANRNAPIVFDGWNFLA
ncbi:MAG: hypothetical protein IAE89_16930 [Anaerolineae bacterium]|nr:hypothetical protein [Anaerolineae bacterium]